MYRAGILVGQHSHFCLRLWAMADPKKGTPEYQAKLDDNRVKKAKKRKALQLERLKFKARFLIRAARADGSAEPKEERDKQVRLKNKCMVEARDLRKEVEELRARVRKQDVKIWAADRNLERQKELNLNLINRLANRQRHSGGKAKGKGKGKAKGKGKGKANDF